MIEAMEVLLCAWGREALDPAIDVSIGSPLARLGEDAPCGRVGSRCLSTVEHWVALSRAAQAVDSALDDLALDAPLGLGTVGRTMLQLALVRYCQPRPLPVLEQARRLGISVRTYRTRVDALHVALRAALPGVAAALDRAEQQLPATKARAERVRDAVKVSRAEQRKLERKLERQVARGLFKAAS